MKRTSTKRIELDIAELEQIVERAQLSDGDRAKLRAVFETLASMTLELQNKGTSIGRLRKLIFGASTEKLAKLFKPTAGVGPSSIDDRETPTGAIEGNGKQADTSEEKKKRKGHGRRSAASYRGAPKVDVAHESLKPLDLCPACNDGKLYKLAAPALVVRIKGQAPLGGLVYQLQRLRCNLCGDVFTASVPKEVGNDKYDPSAGAMIALFKYGSGFPFNRLARLQSGIGIPLPTTTQWDLVHDLSKSAKPAHEELIRQAAQGQVLHNDDTTMKVLALMKNNGTANDHAPSRADDDEDSERTGVFTTGIISIKDDRRIGLFFTGQQHAGENLAAVLADRATELDPPIQMCDGLSRNLPGELKTLLANCISHARRRYVDVTANFPDECHHVLEKLGEVYKNDAAAKANSMSNEERLAWHQQQSAPVMKDLKEWLEALLKEKKIEPNSGLGDAINYMLKRWDKLTLFLRVPGAPLDNNICERALKKAILHRKNALFFKTENGAHVGDIFMSLIYTAELCGADPFDYLVALDTHREQVASSPGDWMPWNYRQAGLPTESDHVATG
jgi:hypothetical protein